MAARSQFQAAMINRVFEAGLISNNLIFLVKFVLS